MFSIYFLLSSYGAQRALHSFPTRRSSDLVKVIIKYPNWYEHFQGLGYDLDKQSKMFDGIYTGTETRDPVITDQHLQQYERDRKSTRLNSSHRCISYAVFCLKKKNKER